MSEQANVMQEIREMWKLLTDEERKELTDYAEWLIAERKRAGTLSKQLQSLPVHMREIMFLRHVHGLKWRVIAEKTHYSERWCHTLEKKALEMLKG